MGDHSEPWEDENVDLRVSEEPKEVLVKDGVTTPSRVEEGGV